MVSARRPQPSSLNLILILELLSEYKINSYKKFILFVNSETFVIDNLLVTTHVVRLKLFKLKAEGVRRVRLPYFSGNI